MLALQKEIPREGCLDAFFLTFRYLKVKNKLRMVFNPTYSAVDMSELNICYWKNFYGNLKEAIQLDALDPQGKKVGMRLYVDSNHSGEQRT